MSPRVLTTNATITCPHGGSGTTVPSSPDWSVNGGTVCLENDTGTLGCPNTPPCVGYTLRSMGLNATTVEGRKVILVTDFQQSFTSLPLSLSESHDTYDDSTTASIPAGQAAPPVTAQMADMAPPVVTVAPPMMAFVTSTMLPPVAVFTFTLTTAFPLEWVLTLINGTLGTSIDATNGVPGVVTVAPAGGSWSTATTVVVATFTAAGMASLTPGTHHLYMTGVSERGLFGLADARLVVS